MRECVAKCLLMCLRRGKSQSFRENPTGSKHDKLSKIWYDKYEFN